MGFNSRQRLVPPMPAVNLLPLMDVLMSILAFFILISMTLTRQQLAIDVELPGVGEGSSVQATSEVLIVGLNREGEISIAGETKTQPQLLAAIEAYLAANPQGSVMLQADRQLSYEQVLQLLGQMREVGGERVSLAINPE
ncbi:MAG: biopolymer transporter ExbD [Cyanobacteriota bacterium]|nr:biopolymer transporter ExbD [Cyanobacteriota bacterium]